MNWDSLLSGRGSNRKLLTVVARIGDIGVCASRTWRRGGRACRAERSFGARTTFRSICQVRLGAHNNIIETDTNSGAGISTYTQRPIESQSSISSHNVSMDKDSKKKEYPGNERRKNETAAEKVPAGQGYCVAKVVFVGQ